MRCVTDASYELEVVKGCQLLRTELNGRSILARMERACGWRWKDSKVVFLECNNLNRVESKTEKVANFLIIISVMSDPILSTPVSRVLDSENIPYRLFTHQGPIHSLEQAARERGQRPEQVVRSLLFRTHSA